MQAMSAGRSASSGRSWRGAERAGLVLCALAWVTVLLAPGEASAASSGGSPLSSNLEALSRPAVVQASSARQAGVAGLPASGPGSLVRTGDGVLVEIRFSGDRSLDPAAVRDAGADVAHVASRYDTVTASVPLEDLRALAGVPGVAGVTEVLQPITRATCQGSRTSEGDTQLAAAGARATFGVDGSGVTVGILSDTYDTAGNLPTNEATDIATGDLPGPGNPCGHITPVDDILDPAIGGGDEGRAMAQIVHDLAPGANMSFESAFLGEIAFAAAIRDLASRGAKVIVDDVGYFDEPFFQDGPVAKAVTDVSAAGVPYFSAAANDNLIDSGGNNVATWEAPAYRPTACPLAVTAANPAAVSCMDFDPGPGADAEFAMTLGKDPVFDLQWAQPWYGVHTDLDLYILDSAGTTVLAKSENDNPGATRIPAEIAGKTAAAGGDYRVVISRNSNGDSDFPRLKLLAMQSSSFTPVSEYPQSAGGDIVGPSIYGHAGTAAANSVAAVRYNTLAAPEAFSSRGPVTHYFGPVTGTTPAAALGSPETVAKPDFTATDGNQNTFFGSQQLPNTTWRFLGTSAAAPHAAAIAALMLQGNAQLTPAAVRNALAATALPPSPAIFNGFGADDVGAGLVQATGAVGQTITAPTVSITAPASPANNPQPAIAFAASHGSTFTCSVDSGAPVACSSPYQVPAPLADGGHTFAVVATDFQARTGSASASFAIDTVGPRTKISKRPGARTRARRVTFRFSTEAGARSQCRLGGKPWQGCTGSRTYGVRPGRHTFRVRSIDPVGNVGPLIAKSWRRLPPER